MDMLCELSNAAKNTKHLLYIIIIIIIIMWWGKSKESKVICKTQLQASFLTQKKCNSFSLTWMRDYMGELLFLWNFSHLNQLIQNIFMTAVYLTALVCGIYI